MDGKSGVAFRIASDRKMTNVKAFEWNPGMDLLAVLYGDASTLNVYRVVFEDGKMTKLFSDKIVDGTTLVWSPCGKYICVGEKTGKITVFDVEGGKYQRETLKQELVALDWVPVKSSADFRTGTESMLPLLSVPSTAASSEDSSVVSPDEDRMWSLLLVADENSLSIDAQASFSLAKITLPPGPPITSARLGLDLRSLSVIRGNKLTLFRIHRLAVRRQEIREAATLIQRGDFVCKYCVMILDGMRRTWNNATGPWLKKVKELTDSASIEEGRTIHQEILIASCRGMTNDKMGQFFKNTTESALNRMEKALMQAFEYINLVVTTRLMVAAQHLLILGNDLLSRADAPAYAYTGLSPSLCQEVLTKAKELATISETLLDALKNERSFIKIFFSVLVRLSNKVNSTNRSNDSKDISKKDLDCFVRKMTQGHSLTLKPVAAKLFDIFSGKPSLIRAIRNVLKSVRSVGKGVTKTLSTNFKKMKTLPLPLNRRDTHQAWFKDELIITWIENDQVVCIRVKPSAGGFEATYHKATLFSLGCNILLARAYAENEIVLVFSSQGLPFLTRIKLENIQFVEVEKCSTRVTPFDLIKIDLEIRQLPDGYQHSSDLSSSASRGVLSIFASKVKRFLTIDMDEASDDES